jgi:DNA-binding IclR family transcriptional regulator
MNGKSIALHSGTLGGIMQKSEILVINKAAAVLRLCAEMNRGLSLGDISERLGFPRSTVQRIVNSLRSEDLLSTEDSYRSIRLGNGLFALTSQPHLDVVEIAHPFLKDLAQETGETVDLAMLRNDHLVFVDQVTGNHRLRAISSVGEAFPLHNTANGKAVLALMPESEIRKKLSATLDRVKRGPKKFLEEIDAIRIAGVAEDRQEHTEGICAIGTAFRVMSGIYALSMPMPTVRFEIRRTQLKERLLAARENILTAIKEASD